MKLIIAASKKEDLESVKNHIVSLGYQIESITYIGGEAHMVFVKDKC